MVDEERNVQINYWFIHEIGRRVVESPHTPWKQSGEIFKYWINIDPKLKKKLKDIDVKEEELLAGDVVAANKVLCDTENPWNNVEKILSDERIMNRFFQDRICGKEEKILRNAGLGLLLEEVNCLELTYSTQSLMFATDQVLELYGFVNIRTGWFARNGILESTINFDRIKSSIVLPFDDFVLKSEYTRGLDRAWLMAHHTQNGGRDGNYHSRMLLSSVQLFPGETLDLNAARVRYAKEKRDPLALALKEGISVTLDEEVLFEREKKTVKVYAYNPRLLLRALSQGHEKPERKYYFQRVAGLVVPLLDRPDMKQQETGAVTVMIDRAFGRHMPQTDDRQIDLIQRVHLGFGKTDIKVDITPYKTLLETPMMRRMRDVKSLGNRSHQHLCYAVQSRLEHMIGVMHIARIIGHRLKLSKTDQTLVELYALTHDIGHLSGGHATEQYFKAIMGFDHEEYSVLLLEQNRAGIENLVPLENLVAMFEGKNPLHDIVDGPFGADRIYYMSVDPNENGMKRTYDPLDIIKWLHWDEKEKRLVVAEYVSAAHEFLSARAELFKKIYFSRETQIADAYERKMLWLAQIIEPFQNVHLPYDSGVTFVPKGGLEVPFANLNDSMFEYAMVQHPNVNVAEVMRHLLDVYSRSPHATAVVLKLQGETEENVEIPFYPELLFAEIPPKVEEVRQEELNEFVKRWKTPKEQARLEKMIAEKTRTQDRHIIAAAVTNMSKVAEEYAPVRCGSATKSLFDWKPEYSKQFSERMRGMACLRIAVHPQIYPHVWNYFQDNSFLGLAREWAKE